MSVSRASSKSRGRSGRNSPRTSPPAKAGKDRVRSGGGSGNTGRITTGGPPGTQNGNSSQAKPQDQSRVSEEARKSETETTRGDELIAGIGEWATEEAGSSEDSAKTGETTESSEAAKETPETPQLQLAQGELLRKGRGSSPEKVTQLQEMLNANGANLEVDGRFGPLTEAAVRQYQQDNELQVDGIVGPQTMGALNSGKSETGEAEAAETQTEDQQVPGEVGQLSLADPNMTPQEQFEHYQRIIEANGGQLNADGATVLGLRGLGTDGNRHDGTSNIGGYDDSFVVLNRDAEGNPTVQTFSGATHANQYSSSQSHGPDADGNTVYGVAMLQPGHYDVNYHSGNYAGRGAPSYHVTDDGSNYVPAFRDVDKNGEISAGERKDALDDGYRATDILFHPGSENAPISIGCLTMNPDVMNLFAKAVGDGGFDFTLLDANSSVVPG